MSKHWAIRLTVTVLSGRGFLASGKVVRAAFSPHFHGASYGQGGVVCNHQVEGKWHHNIDCPVRTALWRKQSGLNRKDHKEHKADHERGLKVE